MSKWIISLVIAALVMSLQSYGNQSTGHLHEAVDSLLIKQDRKDAADKRTLVLEPFKIVEGGSGKVLLQMDKDGKFQLLNGFTATITSAGEIITEEGGLRAYLKGDQLMTCDNELVFTIKEDGTVSIGSEPEMTWGPDGLLTNSNISLKLVPADTKARIAASLLLSAFMAVVAKN